jgi:DNA polymerase elongation subunit (family B)
MPEGRPASGFKRPDQGLAGVNRFTKYRMRKNYTDELRRTVDPANTDLMFWMSVLEYSYKKKLGTVVHVYGNLEGTSAPIHVQVTGFRPHFWILKPKDWNRDNVRSFIEMLEIHLRNYAHKLAYRGKGDFEMQKVLDDNPNLICGYALEMAEEQCMPRGWRQEKQEDGSVKWKCDMEFIDIYVVYPKLVKLIKDLLFYPAGMYARNTRSEIIPSWCPVEWRKVVREMRIYEAHVDFIIRFLVDNNFTPCTWFKIPQKKYEIVSRENWMRHSTCDIEVRIDVKDLINVKDDPKYKNLSPELTMFFFDDECLTSGRFFPRPEKDPVIQIAVTVGTHTCSVPDRKYLFALDYIDSIPGVDEIFWFKKEEDLLQAWKDFLVAFDPDIVSHHNGDLFDIPYNKKRAEVLGLGKDFDKFGRAIWKGVYHKENENKGFRKGEVIIPGRLDIDLFRKAQDDTKLVEHNLNALAAAYLEGDTKEEIHYSMIATYQKTLENRRKLGRYCVKDAYIVHRIFNKKKIPQSVCGMGRTANIPPQIGVNRAQGAKIEGQIKLECQKPGQIKKLMITRRKSEKRGYASMQPTPSTAKRQAAPPPKKKHKHQKQPKKKKKKKRRTEDPASILDADMHQELETTSSDEEEEDDSEDEASPAPVEEEEEIMVDEDAVWVDEAFEDRGKGSVDNDNGVPLGDAILQLERAAQITSEDVKNFFAPKKVASSNPDEPDDKPKKKKKKAPEEPKPSESVDKVLPDLFVSKAALENKGLANENDTYDGATVLVPKCGFYRDVPVITLDFAGMYPSIMMAYNLCHRTLVNKETIAELNLKRSGPDPKTGKWVQRDYWQVTDFEIVEIRDKTTGRLIEKKIVDVDREGLPCFLEPTFMKGIIPLLEERLKKERGGIKFLMGTIKKEIEAIKKDIGILDLEKRIEEQKAAKDPFQKEHDELEKAFLVQAATPEHRARMVELKTKLKEFKDAMDSLSKEIKKLMATPKGEQIAQLQYSYDNENVAQDVIKLIQNSVYGVTGDTTSTYYQREIAETVTRMGRRMIATIKMLAEQEFCRAKGWWFDSEVIYGDTDSIFVALHGFGDVTKWETIAEACDVGTYMAQTITKMAFRERPGQEAINLEFEKVFTNLNMIGPKNYWGLIWMVNQLAPNTMIKGLECIKRGPCKFIKDTCKKALKMVCEKGDYEGAINFVAGQFDLLRSRAVHIGELMQQQKLSQALKEYEKVTKYKDKWGNIKERKSSVSPFVSLAKRLTVEDPVNQEIIEKNKKKKPGQKHEPLIQIFSAGSIVSIVMTDKDNKISDKKGDNVEDPITALREKIPVDYGHYIEALEKQVTKVLGNTILYHTGTTIEFHDIEALEKKRKATDQPDAGDLPSLIPKRGKRIEDLAAEKRVLTKETERLKRKIDKMKKDEEKYPDRDYSDQIRSCEEERAPKMMRLKWVNTNLNSMKNQVRVKVLDVIRARCKKPVTVKPIQTKSAMFRYVERGRICVCCGKDLKHPYKTADPRIKTCYNEGCYKKKEDCTCKPPTLVSDENGELICRNEGCFKKQKDCKCALPKIGDERCIECGNPLGSCTHRRSQQSPDICQACYPVFEQTLETEVKLMEKLKKEDDAVWEKCIKCWAADNREDPKVCESISCTTYHERDKAGLALSTQKGKLEKMYKCYRGLGGSKEYSW